MTTDPRIGKTPKSSPLQPPVNPPIDPPAKPSVKPMYEKEWDDTETAAGDILDKRKQKKKEDK
jgi:hypothetical protein